MIDNVPLIVKLSKMMLFNVILLIVLISFNGIRCIFSKNQHIFLLRHVKSYFLSNKPEIKVSLELMGKNNLDYFTLDPDFNHDQGCNHCHLMVGAASKD